jgi:protein-tyrosine phosphatase
MTDSTRKPRNILTVCTGNICRSPMAEGILRALLKVVPDVGVSSAGTNALIGNPATDFAIIAADEKGIDISGHKARMVGEEMIRASSTILCMEFFHVEYILEIDVSAESKTFNLAQFSEGGKRLNKISDPYGCSLREFRECFQDINVCIRNFLVSEYFVR